MTADKLYGRLPIALQNMACSAEGWRIQRVRYNHDFRDRLRGAEARAALSPEALLRERDDRLRTFVEHAARTVPYYRRLFARLGAEPGDFTTLADLASLPILTKQIVQEDPQSFLSDAVSAGERIVQHTSGTTGGGLGVATTQATLREQYATWWRYYRSHGITPGTWCAYFGGRTVVPLHQSSAPFWRINVPGRQILFSTYHTRTENLAAYLQEIRRVRPPWIHGYPSHIALIAGHVIETKFDLGYTPRWITTGAENLLAQQAAVIEQAFGTRPIQHYGLVEGVANISQCPLGNLHVDEDFAAAEFVDLASDREYCSLVGTNFSNPAMPLLRYDTQDHMRLGTGWCTCGRGGRIVASIDGRGEDSVLLANGAQSGPIDHIFKDLTSIREAQVRQRGVGDLLFLVVKGTGFGEGDALAMHREIRARLGDDMKYEVSYVNQLERSSRGKLRFVVNDMRAS